MTDCRPFKLNYRSTNIPPWLSHNDFRPIVRAVLHLTTLACSGAGTEEGGGDRRLPSPAPSTPPPSLPTTYTHTHLCMSVSGTGPLIWDCILARPPPSHYIPTPFLGEGVVALRHNSLDPSFAEPVEYRVHTDTEGKRNRKRTRGCP